MGYVIRHSTSNVNKSRRKGNVAIGTDADGYDKTSVSGFYAGVAPVEGKNNLVRTSATGDPDFYALDDTELINFANSLGGSVSTVLTAKQYLLTRDDIIFTDELPDDIITDNLVIDLDASVEASFLDNQPTINQANNNVERTLVLHSVGSYGQVAILEDAPERGPGWKKIVVQDRGSNFRIAQFPYISHPQGVSKTYSLEYDFSNVSGYYWRLDGTSGGVGTTTNNGSKISISFDSADRARSLAMFLNHNGTGVDGLNDVIYYRYYQVEEQASATPYTDDTRTQNTTWYDLSGNSDNVTSINGTTFDPEKGFRFDGTDDYMQINSTVDLGNPCTVTALINVESVGSYTIYGPTANGHDNWLGTNGTQLEMFGTETSDTNNFTVRGNSLVCDGTRWHHVACTIDGATAKVWIDGNEKNSTTRSFEIGGWDSTAGLGRRGFISQRYFPGRIAKIQGYSKALSSNEMKQNYYQGDIVTDGLLFSTDSGNLVSYESGSTVAYNMTGSISGSLINGVNYVNSNGGAWDFDGTDEGIQFSTDFNLSSYSSLTYEGWVKGKGVTTLDRWFSGTNSTSNNGYHYPDLAMNSGGNLFYYFNSLATGWANTGVAISTTEYSHIVFTFYNDGKVELFVNGSLVYTTTHSSGTFPSISRYMIGNRYDRNGEAILGEVAIVRTYNRALSPSEVLQNYNTQKTRFL
jgi:hypothetical protein